MITDIFFDLDHTLWDFERNSALAFAKVLCKHRIETPLDEFLSHYIPLNLIYWQRFRNDEVSQDELRYGRLKDTFDRLGYAISDSQIDAIANDYIFHLPEYNYLFDGTVEILDYLSRKYRLHIITNGFHEVQHRKIDGAKIAHYFMTVTNSEMAGVKKPHPGIFEHALAVAKVKKENAIMVGDCIEADVRGAMNFGIDAILFSNKTEAGIKCVSRLEDLKKYL